MRCHLSLLLHVDSVFRCDNYQKQQSADVSRTIRVLSEASERLLSEFALRHGIVCSTVLIVKVCLSEDTTLSDILFLGTLYKFSYFLNFFKNVFAVFSVYSFMVFSLTDFCSESMEKSQMCKFLIT